MSSSSNNLPQASTVLNIDDLMKHTDSVVDLSIADGVENEKCIIAQFKTTIEAKETFKQHLTNCSYNKIPIEWVIDIADESNGWFYATAYDYDDTTQLLHVMVPDKLNPTFDGHVQLDHRTVHLVECVDGVSEALFNKIIRDSAIKVRWELEYFEEPYSEDPNQQAQLAEGKWLPSFAKYFFRMANQLLVEEGENGLLILLADANVRLKYCHKGRGAEDFLRLITEGLVQYSEEALESVKITNQEPQANTTNNFNEADLLPPPPPTNSNQPTVITESEQSNPVHGLSVNTKHNNKGERNRDKAETPTGSSSSKEVIKRLSVMSSDLRYSLDEIIKEREKNFREKKS